MVINKHIHTMHTEITHYTVEIIYRSYKSL